MKHIITLLSILVLINFSYSQTDVKGNISEDITWEKSKSPYNVTENISVAKDVTLTIQPGVKINFATYSKMTVNGKLLAEGTAQDSIIFTGNQWSGITIDYASKGSKIKYSRISNANADWCPNGNCYGQIMLNKTELSNSNIYNIRNGISANNQSVIKFNEIHDMNNTGLELYGGSEAYGNELYQSNNNYNNSNRFFINISGNDSMYDYETNQTIYGDYTSIFRGNKVYGIFRAISIGQHSLVEKNNISYNITSSQLSNAAGGYLPIGIWSCGSQNSDSIPKIKNNIISGFGINAFLAGNIEFIGNTFGGSMDFENGQRNIYSTVLQYGNRSCMNYSNEAEIILNAQSNFWENVTVENIPKSITDFVDNTENKYKVNYSNYLTIPDSSTPISSPKEFSRIVSGDDLTFNWKKNIESDIKGYKLYFKKTSLNSRIYNEVIDLGNTNSYKLEGGKRGFEYALTAYDNDVDGTNDFADGNESNYTTIPGEYLIQKDDPFIGLSKSSVSWGDFDNDGDKDVAIMGQSNQSGAFTDIYRNDNGEFSRMNQNFNNLYDGDLSWVDLNKDGFLDLVVSGYNKTPQLNIYISQNDAQFFSKSENDYGLPELFSSKMAWGDLDNDGDIDLAISGIDAENKSVFSVYYRENGSENFIKETNFTGSLESNGYLEIVDIDLDGDNDIKYSGGIRINSFFRSNYNYNNSYWNYNAPVKNSSIGFLKSPLSNFLDYLEMGEDSNGNLSSNSAIGINIKLKNGDIAVGDYNNDGIDDIVVTGENENGVPVTKLFNGQSQSQGAMYYYFVESPTELIGLRESTANWVDYDMDGDLDLFLSGMDTNGAKTILYETEVEEIYNQSPPKVTGLKAEDLGNGKIKFSWDTPDDDISKNIGYVLRLGTTSGGTELSNTFSNLETGDRLITLPPPIYSNSFETVLDPGKYYFAVQAIDGGLKAGEFSDESSYVLKYEWKLLNQGGIVDRKIQGNSNPIMKIGDIDNDSDLDLIYGSSEYNNMYAGGANTRVFKFDGSRLIEDNNNDDYWSRGPIEQTNRISDIDIGDINGDGFSDVVINSFQSDNADNNSNYLKLFIGDSNGNMNQQTLDAGLYKGKVKIIDMNNDGKSEVVLIGLTASNTSGKPKIFIYEGTVSSGQSDQGGSTIPDISFEKIDVSTQVDELTYASYDLGDVDNDQDIDILISGFDESQGLKSYIYENVGKMGLSYELKKTNNNLAAIRDGTVDFIDFDSDGDLDAAISGTGLQGDIFEIYRNDLEDGKENWPRIDLGLTGMRNGKTDLGDFNGDGFTDIIYSGLLEGIGQVTKLAEYDKESNTYKDSSFDVSDIINASVEFGDIDGDGDLDFVLSGEDKDGLSNNYDPWSDSKYIFRAYLNKRNESALVEEEQSGSRGLANFNDNSYFENAPPSVPEIISTKILLSEQTKEGNLVVEFSWNSSTDDKTPVEGLTYSLKIGTSENGEEIMSANSNFDGLRKTAEKGNAEHNLKWKVSLPTGEYFWSVQAIDAAYNGSKFSESRKFIASTDLKLGDSNGDKSVNVLDLTNIIDKILGNDVNIWVQETSDINNDGVIDVIDISGLVNIILNTNTNSGLVNGLDPARNLNYYSNVPVGKLKIIYSGNKLYFDSENEVTGIQFTINKNIDHLFNKNLIENLNIIKYISDDKINYIIYSNDNKSIANFSNIIFTYVDKKLKDFEISEIKASTSKGLTLKAIYSDESFFDEESEVLKVYPNPINNNLNILGSIENDLNIIDVKIYNTIGVMVYEKSFDSIDRFRELDLSSLVSGIYVIKINSSIGKDITKNHVYKFIKN